MSLFAMSSVCVYYPFSSFVFLLRRQRTVSSVGYASFRPFQCRAIVDFMNCSYCLLMVTFVHVLIQLLTCSVMIASHVSVYVKQELNRSLCLLLPFVLFTMVISVWTLVFYVLSCCRNTLSPVGCVAAALLAVSRLSLFFYF
jgi:hypothetical protein